MAVPAISTITPAVGLPAGRGRVELTGTDFRFPVSPVGTGPTVGADEFTQADWKRTVSVKINGREADDVIPISATQVWVITPPFRGLPSALPATVDLRLANLDDSGVEIPTESVTVIDGFEYKRQDLTADSDVAQVQRELLDRLARNIVENVAVNTGLDFSDTPILDLLSIADLPAIMLFGPDEEEDEESDERNERLTPSAGGDDVFTNAAPWTTSLIWRILVLSDDKNEAQNLLSLIVLDFRKRPRLIVETFSGSGVEVELELFIDDTWVSSDDFGDEIHGYENSLRIRGLQIDETYGVETGGVPVEGVVAPLSDDTDDVPTLQVQQGIT